MWPKLVSKSAPEAGGKGIIEAEAAKGTHANGDQGPYIAQKCATEGQQDEEEVVGAVVVQVALDAGHQLVLVR